MLSVPQKIADEADAEAILNASYRLDAPLGVPTLIIDPADFSREQSFWSLMRDGDTIEKRVMSQLGRMLNMFYRRPAVKEFMKNPGIVRTKIINALDKAQSGNQLTARSFTHNLFNVVICPRTRDTASLLMKHGLHIPEEKIPDMPGYNAQWNFIKLWHEFAHGVVGESESHADKVCAMIHQHVFADATPLMAFADFRATQALIQHEDVSSLTKYGWPLVDTIDQVLEAKETPGTWDDTVYQALKPPLHAPQIDDVQFIGRSLKRISRIAFAEPDLMMLGMMTDTMVSRGHVENENQLRIARRFSIAAQRLSIGEPAYAVFAPKLSL